MAYSHRVVARRLSPGARRESPRGSAWPKGTPLLHLRTVHYGDGRPFQLEDRWLNPGAIPGVESVDFRQMNANEWLVRNAPYLRADLTFSAANADAHDARLLETEPGRRCWSCTGRPGTTSGAITTVRLACHPGYRMSAAI